MERHGVGPRQDDSCRLSPPTRPSGGLPAGKRPVIGPREKRGETSSSTRQASGWDGQAGWASGAGRVIPSAVRSGGPLRTSAHRHAERRAPLAALRAAGLGRGPFGCCNLCVRGMVRHQKRNLSAVRGASCRPFLKCHASWTITVASLSTHSWLSGFWSGHFAQRKISLPG